MGIEPATALNLHKHYENKFSLKRATNVHQYLSCVLGKWSHLRENSHLPTRDYY